MIQTKEFTDLPVNRAEALRYAFCRRPDEAANALLDQCLEEALPKLRYRVCWKEYPVRLEGKTIDFGEFQLTSRTLAKHLSGCSRAVVFGATVSVDMDRLIAKYGYISPAKGLMMQAIGTERIETLCDVFCDGLGQTRLRFSPGYGDLKLAAQQVIFEQLDCARQIGLTLNDSLVMSPSKAVTAIVGLVD